MKDRNIENRKRPKELRNRKKGKKKERSLIRKEESKKIRQGKANL